MRRLNLGQTVRIDLDEVEDTIEAIVVGKAPHTATLSSGTEPARELADQLAEGAFGYLVFDHGTRQVALRGAARHAAVDPLLDFVVLDGVQLPERRAGERVAVSLAAEICHFGPDGRPGDLVPTTTINLSTGGALLHRPAGFPGSGRVRLRIALPQRAPLELDAVPVRLSETTVAVKFQS